MTESEYIKLYNKRETFLKIITSKNISTVDAELILDTAFEILYVNRAKIISSGQSYLDKLIQYRIGSYFTHGKKVVDGKEAWEILKSDKVLYEKYREIKKQYSKDYHKRNRQKLNEASAKYRREVLGQIPRKQKTA